MKILLQRVSEASVSVNNQTIGQIKQGLLLLVGIEKHDDRHSIEKMAKKVSAYRVFSDGEGKMNLNVQQVNGGILAVSQFTLAADTQKGLRPSFSSAAAPEHAIELFHHFIDEVGTYIDDVETGEFGADMQVQLVNDGPVTFMLEC